MNLDDLISKYLDGELTPKDDSELRRLINEDVAAKEVFDAHVLIHAAMKEDAEDIHPSMNLVGKTEDKILARIMKDKPIVTVRYAKPGKRVFAFASLVFAILLLGFLTITDVALYSPQNNIAAVLNSEKDRLVKSDGLMQSVLFSHNEENSPELVMTVPNESSVNHSRIFTGDFALNGNPVGSGNRNLNSDQNNGTDGAVVTNTILPQPTIIETNNATEPDVMASNESITPTETHDNIKPNNSEVSNPQNIDTRTENNGILQKPAIPVEKLIVNNAASETNNAKPDNVAAQPNSFGNIPMQSSQVISASLGYNPLADVNQNFYGKVSDIRLSSFLGTELVRGGFNTNDTKLISNFSQSIAYNFDDNQRMGLDFGYSNYSYNETKIGRLPGRVEFNGSGSGYNSGQNTVLLRDNDGKSWIEYPFTVNVQQQLMWGAGFYERTLLNTKIIKIDGRIGLGGTSEGPLGYTRLFGNLKLFDWLSLNAGADARAFIWKNSAFVNSKSDVKSSISIIYGFEIKL